jgi:hypothetical protein
MAMAFRSAALRERSCPTERFRPAPFDINCGVRMLTSERSETDLRPRLEAVVHEISRSIPSRFGRGARVALSRAERDRVLAEGCPISSDSTGMALLRISTPSRRAAVSPALPQAQSRNGPRHAAPIRSARSAAATTSQDPVCHTYLGSGSSACIIRQEVALKRACARAPRWARRRVARRRACRPDRPRRQ